MVSQLSLFSHGSVGGFWLVTVGLNYLSSSGRVVVVTVLQATGGGLKSVVGSPLLALAVCSTGFLSILLNF